MLCWENKNKTEILCKRYGQFKQRRVYSSYVAYNNLTLSLGPGSAVFFFACSPPTAEPGSGQPGTQCLYSLSSRLFGPSC